MDIQLKRGLLDVCVLKILSVGDSYGYKIVKDLSLHVEMSESTLYPILKRLENSKCVISYSVEHNGRLRKYYQITQLGKERIEEFLEQWKFVTEIYDFIKGEVVDE